MTEGVIWRKMLTFFFPIFLGSLFQQLYTTADAVIVGQFIGKDALASIDAIYNLTKFPLSFFTGLSVAATILISQFYGAKDQKSLDESVHTAVAFSVAGGLALSVIGIIIAAPSMRWLNVPDEIVPDTLAYVRVCFGGTVVSLVYNIAAGILRAVGDSRTPLLYLIVCNCANVALDLLFVVVFKWGVTGAAAATVVSQFASAALTIRHLTRVNMPCKLDLRRVRFHMPTLKKILRIGVPMSLQNILYPISNMVVQSGINAYGVDSIAAYALSGKLDMIVWVASAAFSSTSSTFAAQNYGAKAYDRIKRGTRICLGLTTLVIGAISAVLFIWSKPLGRMIIDDRIVLDMCADIMRLMAPFYVMYALGEVLSGALRGKGETFKQMAITLMGTCGFRVAWALFVPQGRASLLGLLTSYPASWILTTGALAVLYMVHKGRQQD
jgi:putative MATE family efflux protein